jgi:bifunctional non-homologous end joining protein LigD
MKRVALSLRAADILPMRALDKNYPPFTSPEFIYEIKWDGYRCRAGFGAGQPVELCTKSGMNVTSRFLEVAEVLARLPGGPWVTDGELCILDEMGRDFERLRARASSKWVRGADLVCYMVFDLMVDGGQSIMELPLLERKARLKKTLAGAQGTNVIFQGDFPAQKELFDQIVVPLGIEGLWPSSSSPNISQECAAVTGKR